MAFGISTKPATDHRQTVYPHPQQGGPRPRLHHSLQLVSSRKAMDYLEATYQGQRSIRPHHIRFLRHLMRTGHFRAGAEIHLAKIGNEVFLVNGQHTLHAIVMERVPVWLTIIHIDCQTLAEVQHLYESFDRHLTRSLEDIYQADPDMRDLGWNKKQLVSIGSAMSLLASGFQNPTNTLDMIAQLRDPFVRGDLMKAWSLEGSNAFQGLHGPARLRAALMRSACMAVILVSYRWQPEKAHNFWPAVCRDSGLVEGQPARTLVHWLRETPAQTYRPEEYSRYVASAWNAYYEGRELSRLVARASNNPIRLAGTPHDGNWVYYYVNTMGAPLQEPEVREYIGREE